jgi:hypothetical protein
MALKALAFDIVLGSPGLVPFGFQMWFGRRELG